MNGVEGAANLAVNGVEGAANLAVNLVETGATRAVRGLGVVGRGVVTLAEHGATHAVSSIKQGWEQAKQAWSATQTFVGGALTTIGGVAVAAGTAINEHVIQPAWQAAQKGWGMLQAQVQAHFPGLLACWETFKEFAGVAWDKFTQLPLVKETITAVSDIIEGALLGDLIENPSLWNIVGQVIVGFIPGVGQAADLRDLLAMFDKVRTGEASWSELAITLAGIVPGLDALKGLKGVKALDNLDEVTDVVSEIGKGVDNLPPDLVETAVVQADEAADLLRRGDAGMDAAQDATRAADADLPPGSGSPPGPARATPDPEQPAPAPTTNTDAGSGNERGTGGGSGKDDGASGGSGKDDGAGGSGKDDGDGGGSGKDDGDGGGSGKDDGDGDGSGKDDGDGDGSGKDDGDGGGSGKDDGAGDGSGKDDGAGGGSGKDDGDGGGSGKDDGDGGGSGKDDGRSEDPGLDLTDQAKKGQITKPDGAGWKQSPNWQKWTEQGGTIKKHPDGSVTLTTKDGTSVTYSPDGDPDFTPHLDDPWDIRAVELDNGFAVPPNRKEDFKAANEKARQVSNKAQQEKSWGSKSPPGYTWHHMRDGKTMQLVPYEIHSIFTHSGGVADLPK